MNVKDNERMNEIAQRLLKNEQELSDLIHARDKILSGARSAAAAGTLEEFMDEETRKMALDIDARLSKAEAKHTLLSAEFKEVISEETDLDPDDVAIVRDGELVSLKAYRKEQEEEMRNKLGGLLDGLLSKIGSCDECEGKDDCPGRVAKEGVEMGMDPEEADKLIGCDPKKHEC